ncbi:MAG: DUF305 domain-containing protein [bacterium]|nr:DUF305 domain-containing protein [bacterium]
MGYFIRRFSAAIVLVALLPGCGAITGVEQVLDVFELGRLLGDHHTDGELLPVQTQKLFLEAMVPHHEMAIEMATVALDRGQLEEIKDMAQMVIDAQSGEITQMEVIHQRLFLSPIQPSLEAHHELGLSEEAAGMHVEMDSLMAADPFDPEFIDMMILHHQGAIRMARILLANNFDPELETLANSIITAQSAEIQDMNALRSEHYGGPSPSGGVPGEGDAGNHGGEH